MIRSNTAIYNNIIIIHDDFFFNFFVVHRGGARDGVWECPTKQRIDCRQFSRVRRLLFALIDDIRRDHFLISFHTTTASVFPID